MGKPFLHCGKRAGLDKQITDMKWLKRLGLAAAALGIVACFLPWAYYPDLQKSFTGFQTEQNIYGKPGGVLTFLFVCCAVFLLIPRIWAKRLNLIFAGLLVAYCVKCYLLFTACYRGNCPVKEGGMFILLLSAALVMLAALLPDMPLSPGAPSRKA
jgi:hypothetical protein